MPANLPPQYYEAEKVYKQAKTPQEKIAALENMLAIMPKHKGTDHLKAEIRGRIARLHQAQIKKITPHRTSFSIDREGGGQIVLTGLTNSGKSSLLSALTNAAPAVGDFAFTTQTATPGMMGFEDIQIQIIDTPSLSEVSHHWWLPQLLRSADGLALVIDLSHDPVLQIESILDYLARMKIFHLRDESIHDEPGVIHKPMLVICNKDDLSNTESSYAEAANTYSAVLQIASCSVKSKFGIEEIRHKLYELLDVIRVYTKAPGEKAEMAKPVILPAGSNVLDAGNALHRDFGTRLKYARIWGSGKHEGIMVKRDHILADGDVIEFHI